MSALCAGRWLCSAALWCRSPPAGRTRNLLTRGVQGQLQHCINWFSASQEGHGGGGQPEAPHSTSPPRTWRRRSLSPLDRVSRIIPPEFISQEIRDLQTPEKLCTPEPPSSSQNHTEQLTPPSSSQDHTEQLGPPSSSQNHTEQLTPPSSSHYHTEQLTPPSSFQYHTEQLTPPSSSQDHTEQLGPPSSSQDHTEQLTPPSSSQYHTEQLTPPSSSQYHTEQLTPPSSSQNHTEQLTPPSSSQDHTEQLTPPSSSQDHTEQLTPPSSSQYHTEQLTPPSSSQNHTEQLTPPSSSQDHTEQLTPPSSSQDHTEQLTPPSSSQDHTEQLTPLSSFQDHTEQLTPPSPSQDHTEQLGPPSSCQGSGHHGSPGPSASLPTYSASPYSLPISSPPPDRAPSGGVPFQPGDLLMAEFKRRHYSMFRKMFVLKNSGKLVSNWGAIGHQDLLGKLPGEKIRTSTGHQFFLRRPSLDEYVIYMKRGPTISYPKDVAAMLMMMDVNPGDVILEAGSGSGALSLFLSRAVGPEGCVHSIEVRSDHHQVSKRNFLKWKTAWEIRSGRSWPDNVNFINKDVLDAMSDLRSVGFDAVALDMLNPQVALPAIIGNLKQGAVCAAYITNFSQEAMQAVYPYLPYTTETTDWLQRSSGLLYGYVTTAVSITQVIDLLEGIRSCELPLLCEKVMEVSVTDWLVAPSLRKDGRVSKRVEPQWNLSSGTQAQEQTDDGEEEESHTDDDDFVIGSQPFGELPYIARPMPWQIGHTAFLVQLRKFKAASEQTKPKDGRGLHRI